MKRTLVLIGILGLAAPLAAEVAPPRLGPPPPGGEWVFDGEAMVAAEAAQPSAPRAKEVVIRFLQLSQAQQESWDSLLAQLRDTLAPLRQQLADVEEALKELLAQSNPDPKAIGELILDGKEIRREMAAAHQVYLRGFEAMLTTEQKAKLAFLRRAQQAVPLLPAFQVFGLLPPQPR